MNSVSGWLWKAFSFIRLTKYGSIINSLFVDTSHFMLNEADIIFTMFLIKLAILPFIAIFQDFLKYYILEIPIFIFF